MGPADVLRHFNRSWSQRIGALDESFLGSGLPLGPARLLFEVGAEPGTAQALRARLGLDSGHLSRLLRRLEAEGLVDVAPDPEDRRRRLVDVTPRGRSAYEQLDRRSHALAGDLVAPLTTRQQVRLTEALTTADRLLRAATVSIEPVAADGPEARAATAAYFAELDRRLRDGYDAAGQAAEDVARMSPPRGSFLVATSDGLPVACGGTQTFEEGVGEVKRMWVHEDWRGVGLGGRLLRALEQEVAGRGQGVVRLDTTDVLLDAIAMYDRSGYRRIPRYNDNPYARVWFEKVLRPGP